MVGGYRGYAAVLFSLPLNCPVSFMCCPSWTSRHCCTSTDILKLYCYRKLVELSHLLLTSALVSTNAKLRLRHARPTPTSLAGSPALAPPRHSRCLNNHTNGSLDASPDFESIYFRLGLPERVADG